ncbi:MAG: hypothetical protein Q8P99_01190 [bacterium]|nr:hypothetical protein [bacterium]
MTFHGTYAILDGPSRMDLMLALFDRHKRFPGGRRLVTFTVDDRDGGHMEVEARIDTVEAVPGNWTGFNIDAHSRVFELRISYSVSGREGTLTVN